MFTFGVVVSLFWLPFIWAYFDLNDDKINFGLYERREAVPQLTGVPDFSESFLDDIWKDAEWMVEEVDERAKRSTSRSVSHSVRSKLPKEEVKRISKRASEYQTAVHLLSKRGNLTRDASEHILAKRSSPRQDMDPNILCTDRRANCNIRSKYRTQDGTCNNVNSPFRGAAVVRMERLIPPNYDDGVMLPRRSITGAELPGARIVSTNLVSIVNSEDFASSHMTMAFGQFLDHDITSTPNREDLTCCGNNHRDCLAIPIPPDDDQFSQFQIGCMDFQRSHAACGRGPREQINQNTAFIDGSMIYGSTVQTMRNLRTFNGGRLAVSNNNRLPQDTNNANCGQPNRGLSCFIAGDDRVNENPPLSSLHQLFVREHNRIAGVLQGINPGWNDETLFQETRRILGAVIQNIVYSEFLPVVLGTETMNDFRIRLPNSGTTTYQPEINPGIVNSFATAAFRFGHSLIQGNFQLSGAGTFALRDNFNNPRLLYSHDVEQTLLGLTDQPSQRMDGAIDDDVSRFLFRQGNQPFGLDLAAINIQRGRDHGLPSYNDFRDFCGFPRVASFPALRNEFKNPSEADTFSRIYRSVDDIDLWVAGIHERSLPGGLVGPTFGCIIAIQFNRLLYGDRYFFTHANQPGSFTPDQLANIRSRTLAGILCDATLINRIQNRAFLPFSNSNPISDCSTKPALNLGLYRA